MRNDDLFLHINNPRFFKFVERILIKTGFPPDYRGFVYLRNCIIYNMAKKDSKYIDLYYAIARYHYVTVPSVSKAIHAYCSVCQDIIGANIPKLFDFLPKDLLIATKKKKKLMAEPSFIIFSLTTYAILQYKKEGELYPGSLDYDALSEYADCFMDYMLEIKGKIHHENYIMNFEQFRKQPFTPMPKKEPELISNLGLECYFSYDDMKSDYEVYAEIEKQLKARNL